MNACGCSCAAGPDFEGPDAACDVHGMPSVAFQQGVREGRESERSTAALHPSFERETLIARMQDALADEALNEGLNRPLDTKRNRGFEAGVARCIEIVRSAATSAGEAL